MIFWKATAEKAPFNLTAVRRVIAHNKVAKKALQNSEANREKAMPTQWDTLDFSR